MNRDFKKIKISLYKKQILNKLASCNILGIYHVEELSSYTEFNKKVSLLDSIKRKRFCCYNPVTHEYLDVSIIYLEALSYFMKNLNIFKEDGVIMFFIQFKNEYFGLKTILSENLSLIIQISDNKDLLIVKENFSKLASLDILEYDIEVLFFEK